ncbi:hypothetical protein C8Q69DRAFT_441138 [Paecilomyces variotii]|uniref:Uncharacterized protein n=1 Tax=Byssochlamys spectabilis TaxID=264951 RepID=A0A443I7M1_BYSSP|nr:hypothetical protein C8Q69DRAFT_441138 [Paecilomyces variotii]KAJ9199471.1 hypothetical protein DTO032I3_4994 [Paecilomyces variotii]KAJ9277190.1 hypothetical protein DTO021D3_5877 [Paecilomyces variotii]KAJ9288515.1 hypothetical protein DTO021C3_4034 [Paecilomyces variotii]KAJ9320038.1 hypothetical protein DTO027B3_8959 [Paecilomyces variotii]KAJ9347695.1 hypothetical protein DTO027B9_8964 [Paecilomyces variotii]
MASSNGNEAFRRTLRLLDDRISSAEYLQFGADDLQEMNVIVRPASFARTSEDIELKLCFFIPTTSNVLSAPDEQDLAEEFLEFPEYDATREERYGEKSWERARSLERYLSCCVIDCGLDELGWNSLDVSKYKVLWEYKVSQWYVESVYCHNSKYPHVKATMISDHEGNDGTLFRGELLALIRLIRGRLATKSVAHYSNYPVLLFSMMGVQHVRILQAYMDSSTLVIQKSKLYDCRHKNSGLLDFLIAWFLSSPTGELTSSN